MKVLVVGSGGREHALAWWLGRSPRIDRVLCAPGNGGTPGNRPVPVDDAEGLVALATREAVDVVVVGPEVPLVAGLADRLRAAGVPTFGPSAAAARLEGSKAWAKAAMARWGVPTAASATFTDLDAARRHLDGLAGPPVVKASGLAAGKGVVVAETFDEAAGALRAMLVEGRFGPAGGEVVLEERLAGREVSVLAVCADGDHRLLLAAQDHKRLEDGDRGPNTGGMGAFAPSPLPDGVVAEIEAQAIRPVLDGLAAEGHPYQGVLYAGVMLTDAGPRVLEYNCRLGDPETQVILPLLATDPAELLEGTLAGRLPALRWRDGAAATVVVAAAGYPQAPELGGEIAGVEEAEANGCLVFHAGTARRAGDGALVSAGGRVLAVTGVGADLDRAVERAYDGVERIRLDGAHWRGDIGRPTAGLPAPASHRAASGAAGGAPT